MEYEGAQYESKASNINKDSEKEMWNVLSIINILIKTTRREREVRGKRYCIQYRWWIGVEM